MSGGVERGKWAMLKAVRGGVGFPYYLVVLCIMGGHRATNHPANLECQTSSALATYATGREAVET